MGTQVGRLCLSSINDFKSPFIHLEIFSEHLECSIVVSTS